MAGRIGSEARSSTVVTITDLASFAPTAALDGSAVRYELTDSNTPGDVIDVYILTVFQSGEQPYARSAELDDALADAPLRPAGSTLLRSAVEARGRRTELSAGPGWTLRSVRWSDSSAHLTVTAISPALAEDVLARATDGAAAPVSVQDEVVPVGFWHSANGSGRRFQRQVKAEPWGDLRRNYPAGAAVALDKLMTLDADGIHG